MLKDFLHNEYADFKKEFVKDNGPDVEDSFNDPNGDVGPVMNWLRSHDSKLIAKVRKMILSIEIPKDDDTNELAQLRFREKVLEML